MGAVGLLLGGFVVLVAGGELLVRGASGLAEAMGMSPLVVGLTVVAFATSAPELAVTLQAVQDGSPDLAVGNVVGSNIANVLLVLGIAALIGPLAVKSQLVRVDVPVLVGMGALLLVLSLDGLINRTNGALLFSCLVGYVILAVLMGRRESARAAPGPALSDDSPDTAPGAQPAPGPRRHVANLALLVVGVALLVVGAGWLVEGATRIAVERGIPQMVGAGQHGHQAGLESLAGARADSTPCALFVAHVQHRLHDRLRPPGGRPEGVRPHPRHGDAGLDDRLLAGQRAGGGRLRRWPATAARCMWVLVAGFTFFLPELETPQSAEHLTWHERLGLDALTLLKNPDHRVVFITSALFCIPLAGFYPYAPPHLRAARPASTPAPG